MPNQRAEGLEGYRLHIDGEAKDKFLAICKELGLSGNQVINRFIRAVKTSGKLRDEPTTVKVDLTVHAGSKVEPKG